MIHAVPRFVSTVLFGLGITFASSIASAQDELFEVENPDNGAFAYRCAILADLNNDGHDDYAVGAPRESFQSNLDGTVRVYSGKDDALLFEWYGGAAGEQLGWMIEPMGDFDGDGLEDLLISAPGHSAGGGGAGAVLVYSGADGTILLAVHGTAGQGLGDLAAAAGDVNDDGTLDLIAAAFDDGVNGRAYVFSGADGSILDTIDYGGTLPFFLSLSGAGDVNDDDHADYMVGNGLSSGPGGESLTGRLRVFSGADGSVLHDLYGANPQDALGIWVSDYVDLDQDGCDDIVVGVYGEDDVLVDMGAVYVLSGRDASVLHRVVNPRSNTDYASFVGAGGDVNGDGVEDFFTSAYTDFENGGNAGAAFVYSGATGALLYEFHGEPNDSLALMAGGGDLNADGFDDLLIGGGPFAASGVVRGHAGNDVWLLATPRKPEEGDSFALSVREGTPGKLAVIAVVAVNGTPMFVPLGGFGTLVADGSWDVTGTVPPGLTGISMDTIALVQGTGKVMVSAVESVEFQ